MHHHERCNTLIPETDAESLMLTGSSTTPSVVSQYPWLTPSSRKRRRDRIRGYGGAALVLAALAAVQFTPMKFTDWFGGKKTLSRQMSDQASRSRLIESPFAPKSLRPLSAAAAQAWNQRVRATESAVQVASPLSIVDGAGTGFARSLQCMTSAIYYEAGNEPTDGQRAVAQVILNRVRHPEYPHTICGVVFQGAERRTGCQFSFTCDGSLRRPPAPQSWARAQSVAAAALSGAVYAPVGWATHYHADYVVPYWAQSLQKLATIGHHIFYRWSGAAGERGSFTSGYAGAEPLIGLPEPTSSTLEAPLPTSGSIRRIGESERPIIEASPSAAPVQAPVDPSEGKASAQVARPASPPPSPSRERWVIGVPKN